MPLLDRLLAEARRLRTSGDATVNVARAVNVSAPGSRRTARSRQFAPLTQRGGRTSKAADATSERGPGA